MGGEVKQIKIKNRTYYFYNDMINLKNFDSNLLEMTKSITEGLIFTTSVTLQFKKLIIVKVFSV